MTSKLLLTSIIAFLIIFLPGIVYGEIYVNPDDKSRITIVFFLNEVPSESKRYYVQLWKIGSKDTLVSNELFKGKEARFPKAGAENGVMRGYVDAYIKLVDKHASVVSVDSGNDADAFGPSIPSGFEINANIDGEYELRLFEVNANKDSSLIYLKKVKLIKSAMTVPFASGFLISNH